MPHWRNRTGYLPPNRTARSVPLDLTGGAERVAIAAVAGKELWILQLHYTTPAQGTVEWLNDTGGAALTGALPYATDGGVALECLSLEVPLFKTTAGKGLYVVLGAGVNLKGFVTYLEVTP